MRKRLKRKATERRNVCRTKRCEKRTGPRPTPLFFVSVASKEVRDRVSLLFAILVEGSISVAGKGVRLEDRLNARTLECWKVAGRDVRSVKGRAGLADWWLSITTDVILGNL